MIDYAGSRRLMVENQIRTNRVTDELVIEAMRELPREAFVPEPLRGIAYVDEAIPLGNGRFIMEPLATAQLLQAAEISANDLALDVGCSTGYNSAILARLASTVVALESEPKLAEFVQQAFSELRIDTVSVVTGPLTEGYAAQAPYDVIVFGGAIDQPTDAILSQLAEGGRLVAVLKQGNGVGTGTVFTRIRGSISRRQVFGSSTPLLRGFEPQPEFQF